MDPREQSEHCSPRDPLPRAKRAYDRPYVELCPALVYADGDQAKWDEYMREMEPAVARVPYQVCVGNHEHHYNYPQTPATRNSR